MDTFRKDPSAVLDFDVDWSTWLTAPETITSATATAETGVTVQSVTHTDRMAKVWLAGGTRGVDYRVTCHIVTSAGREDDWTFRIEVRET